MVARLERPLNTTKRLVLVVPPLIDRHPGFFATTAVLKRIAAQLGAPLRLLVVGGRAAEYAAHVDGVKPALRVTADGVDAWNELMPRLAAEAGPDDLVVLLSARPGTVAWHPRLERLPARFASRLPGSFVIVFPSQAAPGTATDWLTESAVPSARRI
jgi:hypothetical protein